MATMVLSILPAKPTSAGKFPIFIRISVKNDKSYIKTEYELNDVCQWNNGKVVAHPEATMMNKRLLFELKKYKDRLQYIENYEYFTAKQLKDVLTQQDKFSPDIRTFNEFFRQRIEEHKSEGRESYAKMQEDTLILFKKAEGDVPMVIINNHIVEHFNSWMKKKGYSDGGRQIRLCHIKARVNDAIKSGLIRCELHPFANIRIPSSEPRESDLSIQSLRKIICADFSHSKRLSFAKDVFLLSFYLGGANYTDIIDMDFSGNELVYSRKKVTTTKYGDKTTRIYISEEASTIVSKYIGGDGRLKFNYKFSTKNLQRYINRLLKMIAKELGIKENISFYSARKTFAQFASELGIPDSVIDYCLGHSTKSRGIIRFYTKVKHHQAEVAIKRVIDYTNEPSKYKEYIEMRADIMMMRV